MESSQSRIESLLETIVNIGTGMVIAYCTMQFILAPALDIEITYGENVVVTIALTVVSITRSYLWRRFFAKGLHKVIKEKVRDYYGPGKTIK